MPHFVFSDGTIFDLELEIHSNMKPEDFLGYFESILKGEKVKSKTGEYFQIPTRRIPEFVNESLESNMLKNFTKKNYGRKVWKQLQKLLKSFR